jgi:HEAT repeat protein
MPIRPSSGVEIRHLIDALGASDDVQRETAVARLAVLGPRAIEHLLQAFPTANGRVRAGMLRAFEGAADPRTLPATTAALQDPSALVQTSAIAALRALLGATRGEISRDALDALVTVALDRGRIAAVRIAAIDALREMPADVRAPLDAELSSDPDPDVRARAVEGAGQRRDTWRDAVAGRLPPVPATLKQALASVRASVALTDLQRVIDHVRAEEQRQNDGAVREEWRAVRGALHQALAARNSRLALYDLRDSLLGAERLPVAFLAAIEEIGDATCLEPLAAAYDASSRSRDPWWREHVAAAFRAIVQREGLTRRHAAVKRAMTRWPEAAADLMSRL